MDGCTAEEHISASTTDITAYALFDWYQPVFPHDFVAPFSYQQRVVSQVLGVADNCTEVLAYIISSKK